MYFFAAGQLYNENNDMVLAHVDQCMMILVNTITTINDNNLYQTFDFWLRGTFLFYFLSGQYKN